MNQPNQTIFYENWPASQFFEPFLFLIHPPNRSPEPKRSDATHRMMPSSAFVNGVMQLQWHTSSCITKLV
jgi:hypothetical protein